MKRLLITIFICSTLIPSITAQTGDDHGAYKYNGVWWTNNDVLAPFSYSFSPDERGFTPVDIKNFYSGVKGGFATVTWSSIEPTENHGFNWTDLDNLLDSYAEADFWIMLMVWTGSDAPVKWLVNDLDVQVVKTNDADHYKYPYYFDPIYKQRWYRMLDAVATHIETCSTSTRRKIVVFQSAEGSTGDEGPYKGTVKPDYVAYDFSRNDTRWVQLKKNAWKHLDSLYKPKVPTVHLLVNCDPTDPEDANNFIKDSVNRAWRKASNAGHGYQFNDEVRDKSAFDTLVNVTLSATDSSTKIRCRDEMDQYKTNLFLQAPKENIYWSGLSALYYGLDMWPNNATGIQDTFTNKAAFDIFSRYAGFKNPKYSPGAFCALRDGLDAADSIRFPKTSPSNGGFGQGTQDLGDALGERRCERIAEAFCS